MATFLDISLAQGFQGIFVFLLVWVLTYGVLSYTKPFGSDNKMGIYAFIALAVALLTLFSRPVVAVIITTVPWFIGMALFVFFMLLVFLTLGYKEDHIQSILKSKENSGTIFVWVVVLCAIILLGGIGSVFFSNDNQVISTGTQTLETVDNSAPLGSGDVSGRGADAFFASFFHPRVLGMIVILVIGFLAIQFLARGGTVVK